MTGKIAPEEVEAIAARAVVDAILKRDEDGQPNVWYTDYEPKTPITEAMAVDGEVYPTEIAQAVLAAVRSHLETHKPEQEKGERDIAQPETEN